jgi:hypothetical protein|tara:strand:- start:3 stop:524 length:522 start_codon:yes stop_codon:yes gene_type:complete
MNSETIVLVVQVIAAFGVVVSVVYLGIQIHQQNEITKAQFGHSLTQRQYDRFFQTTKDEKFSEFLAKDWSADDLTNTDKWRINHFIMTCLVDLFDVYDKVKKGFVDESHLNSRISTLRLGVMKSDQGKLMWSFMRNNRTQEFIEWFEYEIYEKGHNNEPEKDDRLKEMNIYRA